MAHKQEQEEEREVLQSIYENEDHFKQHSETVFTFRIGEPGDVKSYSVEIRWGEGYPDEPPTVSLDSIYNSRLTLESKRAIVSALLAEAQSLLGSPMTYSLFEYAKEQAIGLVELETVESAEGTTGDQDGAMKQQKEKKEVLSKQAKRRLADRTRRTAPWLELDGHHSACELVSTDKQLSQYDTLQLSKTEGSNQAST